MDIWRLELGPAGVLTFTGKLSVVLAGALVAADDALDVLFGVDLGAAVAALGVGAVGLGAGRGAAAVVAARRAAQAAGRL